MNVVISYKATDSTSFAASLDGHVRKVTIGATKATGSFAASPGGHTLSVVGRFGDTASTLSSSTTTVTSNFTVSGFAIAPPPLMGPGASEKAFDVAVGVARAPGFTGAVLVALQSAPPGITASSVNAGSGVNSVTVHVDCGGFDFANHDHALFQPITFRGTSTVNGASVTHSVTAKLVIAGNPRKAPTWTELYTLFFGPGTPGHCGKCHNGNPALPRFDSKDVMYESLKGGQWIDPTNMQTARNSLFGNPVGSPVRWVSPEGIMPKDQAEPNDAARDATLEWLADGAKND